MEIYYGYQSADFNKNYTQDNGQYTCQLVDGGLLLEEDETQERPDNYRSLSDGGHIAGLGLGKQGIDSKIMA